MTSAVPPLADLFQGGFGKVMCPDRQLLRQFANAQNANAIGRAIGQPHVQMD